MKPTLSVVITAYNEELKIAEALESVKDFADEIIVVDNSSTDNTAKIAKKYTKKVYAQKNNPDDIDRQKNFGFSKATKDWTLALDADERVTPELKTEIQDVLSHRENVTAYWISRKNIIFGKWIEHTGWYPDHQLRLFQTGKGSYTKEHYHEFITVEGEKAYLHTDLLHFNYETIQQFLSRNLLTYAKNEAIIKVKNGYTFHYLDLLKQPTTEFISRFFGREGYKDGLHGFALSFLMAIYHATIVLYIWQEQKFPQESVSFSEMQKTGESIGKELKYWVLTSQINDEKNPIKKSVLKVKRRTN